MNAKDELLTLHRIQELALEIRQAQAVVEQAPVRIQEIEDRFRERNAEYVAVKDRFDALELDQRTRTGELSELEENRKKFMDDLMQVKNQREYAAMLKEIDSVKAQISEHEEAIIKDMEEIEGLTGELKEHEAHIATERERDDKERAEVESEEQSARRSVEKLSAERKRFESDLSSTQGGTLRKLEETRQGVFLSRADNCTCLSCFVRIRPQVFQEIKLASKVHTCSNCRRFLYYEPTLKPASEAAPAKKDGVEAIDGGST